MKFFLQLQTFSLCLKLVIYQYPAYEFEYDYVVVDNLLEALRMAGVRERLLG